MTTMTQLDQSSTSGATSSGKVTAAGNKQIAQVFVAGYSGNLTSVRVSVTYSGGGNARPRVQLFTAANGAPTTTLLGGVSINTKDIGLGTNVAFASPIPQVADASYAIVVDYPNGKSSDTFSWTASDGADSTRSCLVGAGTSWAAQSNVCDFMTYASNTGATGNLTPDSKGPVI